MCKEKREYYGNYERAFWIDHEIRAGRYPNAPKITKRFEIERKTVYDTVAFMRDRFRLPIEYSAKHRGYYYTEPNVALPTVALTEGELVVILLAERMANVYSGKLGPTVERAFSKIMSSLTDTVSIDLERLDAVHSFEPLPVTEFDRDVFVRLGQAVTHRNMVEMTYFTQSRGESSTRRVEPLHLHNAKAEWYLFAFDHKRGRVLDFHLGRIRDLKVLDERFPPRDFDAKAHVAAGFQMIRGGTLETVVVEFDEYQARWIRQQSKVHPTAEYEDLPDGGLRVTMTVGGEFIGVKLWLMQYGSHVRVVAPESLRALIRDEVRKMAEMYQALS